MAGFLSNLFDKKGRVQKVDIARRFELLARVGQGSMSKVWRARDAMTGKMIAVKVLDKVKTERFEARFVGLKKPSEGVISMSLQHLNVVKTIEHGMTTTDEPYLVMDFVEGVSLSYLVDVQNEQMQMHCLNYVIQLGEAISYLHHQNWIHRDLCPRNVMVDKDHVVKLIDFGLVVPNTPDFQKPGNRTGTANYMAPELIKRQRTDQRIDIYSYSVTAYEMYTRRLPWDVAAQETLETVLQHINKPPTPIKQLAPNIHPLVAETIMKGLLPNPDQRWQTIDELLIPLRKAHEEIEAKRALERRKKAASAKVKSAGADAKAKAIKAADDDAFVDDILSGDGSARSAKPKPKSTASTAASTRSPVKPGLKSPEASSAATKNSSKQSTGSVKKTSTAPKSDAEDDDDDFDGIEIEIEGDKVVAARSDEASDEFDGIEIESEGNADGIRDVADVEDEFEGIEIEEEGERPIEKSVAHAPNAGRKLAMLLDDDDESQSSNNTAKSTKKSAASTASTGKNTDDDDEPVLRLPDDDEDLDDDLTAGIEIEEEAPTPRSFKKPGSGK